MSYRELNRDIWEDVFHWIFWGVCVLLVFFFFLLGFGEGKEKRCIFSDICCCHCIQTGFFPRE